MENYSHRIPFRALWRATLNIVAAIVVVSVLGALGYWGWYLTKRDVSEIPVIRKLEGPVRVQPEDPGGRNFNHTGLLSNKVQEINPKQQEEIVSTIKLAPDSFPSSEKDNQPEPRKTISPEGQGEGNTQDSNAAVPSAVDALAKAQTEIENKPEEAGEDAQEIPEPPAPKISAFAPDRAPFPLKRPANLSEVNRQKSKISAQAGSVSAMNSDNIARGAWLADIEIYDSEVQARAAWDKMAGAFGKLIEGKRRVISPIMVGNTALYNLRVWGFADRAEVRRFCAFLEASAMRCKPLQNG